ncbi:MAG: alpha-L-fucosidase, partial [Planctomycetota bacterium]
QRLSVERLDRWRRLEYGMFIHYGLATFTSQQRGAGVQPVELYRPTDLDVDQWVRVARDAGMRYVILTAKHSRDGGFCNWPTEHSDFSVARSPVKTDVVGAFVTACRTHGVKPAIYIGGDRYNVPGGMVGNARHPFFYVNRAYMDLLLAQLDELLTWYGPIEQVWFDGPHKYGVPGRWELTEHIAARQPETVVAMNGTWEDNGKQPQMKPYAWPSDVIVIEAGVPPIWGTNPWRKLPWDPAGNPADPDAPGLPYYLPVENCTLAHTGSYGWWWGPHVRPRSVEELLGVRLLCKARNANCVLNVTPDRRGRIPDDQAAALFDVRDKMESLGL